MFWLSVAREMKIVNLSKKSETYLFSPEQGSLVG
jgi:hypothetical protein